MRALGILLIAAVLGTAGVAEAQRPRAAANQPAKTTRTKAPVPVAKPKAIPAATVLTQYQRVGRELLLLSNDRRAQIGVETEDAKLSCAELQAMFRSIKINDAVATAQSRAETAELLGELQDKIVRLRGVAVTKDCLDNPLAKDCS
jgi:hypothetical protein